MHKNGVSIDRATGSPSNLKKKQLAPISSNDSLLEDLAQP